MKKFLIGSLTVMTVVWAMGLSAFVATPASAAVGDLVKSASSSTVYVVKADGVTICQFPHANVYKSWGYPSNFSTVMTKDLSSYTVGSNIEFRDASLVKGDGPAVYLVYNNMKRPIISDVVFLGLGYDWDDITWLSDAFLADYTTGAVVDSSTMHPDGQIVKYAGSPAVYLIDNGMKRPFASGAAFEANRYSWGDIITIPDTETYPNGSAISGYEQALSLPNCIGTSVVPSGSGLSAVVSPSTPASMDVPTGSPSEFLKFTLTASNDGDVNLNGLTLRAYGLGNPTNIDDVTIYDGNTKVGNSRNMNSDKTAYFTFSSPVKISSGSTKTFTVKATLAAAGTYALGIGSSADVVTGAVVTGSFPIMGNNMTGVVSSNVGTVTVSSIDGTDQSQRFGTDNVLLASFTLTAANEPVLFESLRLRNGGTNKVGIVENMKVLLNGSEVTTGVEMVDRYVTFNLNNYELPKNTGVTVEVYGDIGIANNNDTVTFYVENNSDASFVGKDLGYGISADFSSFDSVAEAIVVTLTTGDITIDMDKSVNGTPAKDVRPGDTDVVLATFKVTSNGENATLNQIVDSGTDDFEITGTGLTTGEISNVEMRDVSTGALYSIEETFDTNKWTLSMTDQIYLPKGVTKTFQIRADLSGPTSATPIDLNDTLIVTIDGAAMDVSGDVSGATINDITPSTVTGSTITVKTASLTWSTVTLTDKSFVPGAEDVVYRANLTAGNSSNIRLTSVKISTTNNNEVDFSDANIASLSLYLNGALLKTVSNQIVEATAGTQGYITFNTLPSTALVTAGQTVVLEVKAKLAGSFTTSGNQFALGIAHATDSIVALDKDNQSVAESLSQAVNTGSRNITFASVGTLMVELRTSDLKADVDTYLLAGAGTTMNRYLGELLFTTANEPIKVKTLVLGQNGDAVASDLKSVRLYDGTGTMVAEIQPNANGHAYFDNLDLVLPADQATSIFIGAVAKSINANGDAEGTATFGRNIQFNIASSSQVTDVNATAAITADGVDSGQPITIAQDGGSGLIAGEYSAPTVTSKTATITGSVLNSITNSMSNSNLVQGTDQKVGEYKFIFDNSANRNSDNTELKAEMNQLKLTFSTSSGVSVTNVQAYISGSPTNKTSATTTVAGVATIDLTTLTGTTELVDGEVTLVIEADVTVSTTGAKYLQTKINNLATDFTYNGNNGTGTDFSNARLDYVEVTGANLSATF